MNLRYPKTRKIEWFLLMICTKMFTLDSIQNWGGGYVEIQSKAEWGLENIPI